MQLVYIYLAMFNGALKIGQGQQTMPVLQRCHVSLCEFKSQKVV